MLKSTGCWDIRCPGSLLRMFPVHKGYWFKVNRHEAQIVCWILSRAYKVSMPKVLDDTPKGANGWYFPRRRAMAVHPRAHLKTVFHEWYHHLDNVTGGRYDSSDMPEKYRLTPRSLRTGPASLAWQFADRLFNLMREKYTAPRSRGLVTPQRAIWYFQLPKWRKQWAKLDALRQMKMIAIYLKLKSNQYLNEEDIMKVEKRSAVKETNTPKTKETKRKKPATPAEVETTVKLAFARLMKEQKEEAREEAKARVANTKHAETLTKPKKEPKAKKEPRPGAPPAAEDSKVIKVTPLLKTWLKEGGQKDTKAYRTRALYKDGMTVGQFKEACQTHGGDWNYIKKDNAAAGHANRAFVTLK